MNSSLQPLKTLVYMQKMHTQNQSILKYTDLGFTMCRCGEIGIHDGFKINSVYDEFFATTIENIGIHAKNAYSKPKYTKVYGSWFYYVPVW
jgi:hypothetical protein